MTITTTKNIGSFMLSFTLLFFLLTQIGCKEDPCSEINCQNGGICATDRCICPDGYEGTNCETLAGEPCGSVICLNGGTCVSGRCECPDGWTGENCDTRVPDPCDEISCLNGGACVNGICACPPGFSGEFCEIEDQGDPCNGIVCQNGGTCVSGTCDCPSGFSGPNCEIQDFDCNTSPCLNGGQCDETLGLCECPPGYGGADCGTIIDQCIVNPIDCQNGGECVNGVCDCPPGWTGTNCEIQDTGIGGTYSGTIECMPASGGASTVHDQTVVVTVNGTTVTFEFSGHLNFTADGTAQLGGFTINSGNNVGSVSTIVPGELSFSMASGLPPNQEVCSGTLRP